MVTFSLLNMVYFTKQGTRVGYGIKRSLNKNTKDYLLKNSVISRCYVAEKTPCYT